MIDSNGSRNVEHNENHLNSFECIIYIDIDDIGWINMEFDGNLKYCEYPCAMYAGEKNICSSMSIYFFVMYSAI